MPPSFARNAIVLGLLSGMGPFAIDMYLPALPAIANDLQASTTGVQMSLMAFFLAVALCQIAYGPISDMVGRKPPLYFGLGLFIIGGIGCSLAPSIEVLVAFRFVQGVGACAPMTLPRAIVRDLHRGVDATRLMSLIMLVFSVSPILAPLFGSALIAFASWRAIFLAVTLLGVAAMVVLFLLLPETRPPEKRVRRSPRQVLQGYGVLLRDPYFLGVAMIGGLGLSSFFSFVASSSFVYVDHFGLSPTEYSVAFAFNAIGFIGFAQLNGLLGRRFGLKRLVLGATSSFAVTSVVLFLATALGVDSLWFLMAMLFLSFASLGLVIPNAAVLALEEYGAMAGTASALMGTLQFLTGAIAVVLSSLFFDGSALPMVTAIAFCAVGAFTLARIFLARSWPTPAPAE